MACLNLTEAEIERPRIRRRPEGVGTLVHSEEKAEREKIISTELEGGPPS